MKFVSGREEIVPRRHLTSVLVHNSKKNPVKLQSSRTVKINVRQVESYRKMVTMEKGVFSMQGKEGNQRWSMDKEGNISCKELVKVDNTTLLWAEVLEQEQMTDIEENKNFLIIPTGPVPPPPRDILQEAFLEAQVDFDSNCQKSSQSDGRFSLAQ